MTNLLNILASYVPDLVVQRLETNAAPPQGPTTSTLRAAVLFADISGFSALADRLAQRGPDGAEALSDTVNTVFDELIVLIKVLGGDVVIFAGDGLVALWPATDEDQAISVRRCSQCSLALQALFRDEQIASRVSLTVRMGIGVGDVRVLQIGGINDRWYWLTVGTPVQEAVEAAYKADTPGRVVLSAAAWALVDNMYGGHIYPSGDVRLDAVRDLLPLHYSQPPILETSMEVALRAYVPRGVQARLVAGHAGWLGELRRVTVLFISLPGMLEQSPALDDIQVLMTTIQSILYRYEGSINKLSVDEKGVTIIAALGLPPLSHEDDAIRSIQVALAVEVALCQHDITCSIGIATGQVFCGDVGNEQRREYTMLSTVVNLAAQLMKATTGAVLCDAATYQSARPWFDFETRTALMLKGRTEPTIAYRPIRQIRPVLREQSVLVGRIREKMILTAQLAALVKASAERKAASTWSSAILIEGEAGSGKSSLLDDLHLQALQAGVLVLNTAGLPVEQHTFYQAWQPIVRRLLDLDERAAPADDKQHVLSWLQQHMPTQVPLAPLLNVVLSLNLPETERTSALNVRERSDATRQLLLRLLRRAASRQPVLIRLEDANWLDPASWALAQAAVEQVAPFLLVVALRTSNGSTPPEYTALTRQTRARRLKLQPFTRDELALLIAQRLEASRIPAALIDLIYRHAQGNPFFSEQMIYALRDSHLLTVAEGTCQIAPIANLTHELQFSDTFHSVITARLDRLAPSAQMSLKVASVIGQTFPVRLLQAVYPLPIDPETLQHDLVALQQFDFIQRDPAATEPAYRFKHTITREVVYNLLMFAQRRQVHRAAAEWYERQYADRLDDLAVVIGQHFVEADDMRALPYLVRAGDAAMALYNSQEALVHYDQALAFAQQTRPGNSIDPKMLTLCKHLFLQRGRTLELVARHALALENYEHMEAFALLHDHQPMRLEALLARATLYTLPATTYAPSLAQTTLRQALSLARNLPDQVAEARILWNLMLFSLHTTNDPLQAVTYGEQSLVLARALNLPEQLALTLNDISMAYHASGSLRRSIEVLEEARQHWLKLGNVPMQADNLARLSVNYFLAGHYNEAIRLSHEASTINQSINNLSGGAGSRFTVGNAYFQRGLFSQALGEMEEAIELAEQSDNLAVLVGTCADLGWVYGCLGDIDYGLKLAYRAASIAATRVPVLQVWPLAVQIRLHLLQGNLAAAESLAQTSYQEALAGHNTILAPMLMALAASELAFARRDFARALQPVNDLLEYLNQRGIQAFQTEALLLKGQIMQAMGDRLTALEVLQIAQANAQALDEQHALWRILFAMSQLEAERGKPAAARQLQHKARGILELLTEGIADRRLRERFLQTPLVRAVFVPLAARAARG